MGVATMENVPLLIAMAFVVPQTFEAIRCFLEDKLDLDVVIYKPFLRAVEIILAVMLFPTAFLVLIAIAIFYLVRSLWKYSLRIVDFVYSKKIVKISAYIVTVFCVFCLLCVSFVHLLRFVHSKMK